MRVRLGSRKSPMAIRQTEIVMEKLIELFPDDEFEIIGIASEGDKQQDKPLKDFGSKGVFIKELEKALLDGEIDIAVHSAKDVPTELPDGLEIGAVTERDHAGDVLVSTAEIYPECPIIGTGSERRAFQLKRLFSDKVEIKPIRGNVNTRIEKLRRGEYDAIMLAAASVKRMGFDRDSSLKFRYFDPDEFLPAAGQGIMALEVRCGDMKKYTAAINDDISEHMLGLEREFMTLVGGGCHYPSGVYAYVNDSGECVLHGTLYRDERIADIRLTGRPEELSASVLADKCIKYTEKK